MAATWAVSPRSASSGTPDLVQPWVGRQTAGARPCGVSVDLQMWAVLSTLTYHSQVMETGDETQNPGLADPRSDEELLADHVAGDPEAFALLVARHRDRMWAVALRTMRHREEAADALQEAYISAFRRAETFRGGSKVTTWLHRVVVNACLDRIRRNKVRRAEPLPENPDRAMIMASASQTDHVEVQERRSSVAAALNELNADQRAALVLVDMEGYSVQEAAEILGCAVGTVKSRCHRGRTRLAPLLEHLRSEVGTR